MKLLKGTAWKPISRDQYRTLAETLSKGREWEYCSFTEKLLRPRSSTTVLSLENNFIMQDRTGFVFPIITSEQFGDLRLSYQPRSIMGLANNVTQFCDAARIQPATVIHYTLMVRKPAPVTLHRREIPLVRRLSPEDFLDVLPLETAYQQEEVMLPGQPLHEESVHLHVHTMLQQQRGTGVFHGKHLMAKAHTNARGLQCHQIGGVYTLPEYRSSGWANLAMRALLIELGSHRSFTSLFVKNGNTAGQKLYRRLGFTPTGEYTIAYT